MKAIKNLFKKVEKMFSENSSEQVENKNKEQEVREDFLTLTGKLLQKAKEEDKKADEIGSLVSEVGQNMTGVPITKMWEIFKSATTPPEEAKNKNKNKLN